MGLKDKLSDKAEELLRDLPTLFLIHAKEYDGEDKIWTTQSICTKEELAEEVEEIVELYGEAKISTYINLQE